MIAGNKHEEFATGGEREREMEETKHKELRHSAVNRMGAGRGERRIEK